MWNLAQDVLAMIAEASREEVGFLATNPFDRGHTCDNLVRQTSFGVIR